MRRLFAMIALSTMLTVLKAESATTTTVVDVPTRPGVTQRFLYVRPDAPMANLVMIPGGDGVLGIQSDGSMTAQSARCNPVARNRQAFADAGVSLALVDAASDGTTYLYEDVAAVIRYMQAQNGQPTWINGASSSTSATTYIAATWPAGNPLGVLMFSPAFPDALVSQITRPTFVLYHAADMAQFGGAFYAALTSAQVRENLALTGGSNANCGYHLFQGLDAPFVSAMTSFITRYNLLLANSGPAVAAAVEFYNAALDHYFLSHVPSEIALLDAGVSIKGWARTGQTFNVYPAAQPGASPVCRYYIPPAKGNSHFYGRGTAECTATGLANPTFVNEDSQFFYIGLPAAGVCPAGTRNVYRVFSNRADANHRYTVDVAIRDAMVARGWLAEGDGTALVVMCAPA